MSLCLLGECCSGAKDEDDRIIHDFARVTEIPVKDRKQTDLPYFIILAVIFLSMVISVCVAGSQGDIRRLMYASDEKGNLCGYKNKPIKGVDGSGLDETRKKFLETRRVCPPSGAACWTENQCVENCEDGYEPTIAQLCKKTGRKTHLKTLKSVLEIIITDLGSLWREITALCICSIFLSGLVLTILRMYAKVVIKAVLVIVGIASVSATILSWVMHSENLKSHEKLNDSGNKRLSTSAVNWLGSACFFTTSTVVFFAMLFFIRNKLMLIAVFFEEGGKCIKDIPTMLFQPVLTYLTTAVFLCFVLFGFACLQAPGEVEINKDGKVVFSANRFFQVISWILLFVFLWLSQFILACQHLVVAGAVSSWYFSRIKGQLSNPVWSSFCMIVKYHLGSAAFGSLLIAIIKTFRLIAKMMEGKRGENGIAFIFWSLVQCLLACIESFLRIISKTAYVMIVLFGDPFCRSARKVFNCIMSDSSQIALFIGVETFILTVIELLITVCVAVVGACLFMNKEGLHSLWIPTSAVFILSYLCCNCFFSIYNMTIDSLVVCFCVDHQVFGRFGTPYYMNDNLKILLPGYSNRAQEMAPEGRSNGTPC